VSKYIIQLGKDRPGNDYMPTPLGGCIEEGGGCEIQELVHIGTYKA
jgi:hypothetical protein